MLRNLQILQHYRLTDFWSTRVVQFQSRGPPAHARGLQHEALRRGGSTASSRSHARAREEGRGGGACEIRCGDTVVNRGGGACEIRCGGAGLRSCRGRGECAASVVQKCCQLVGAPRVCGVVGRRGHAHARMQKERIDFGTKSAYFWRQSGCTARIRKAWRWRGSAGSSTYSDVGVTVARECRVVDSQHHASHFLTGIGRLSK